VSAQNEIYKPRNPIRVVTATSLFDGHDAAINIMRRIIQDTGVEVIHLGHNRSVQEIVDAAIEEDVQGVAVSSYQGGHIEFFKYLVDLLRERGATHVKVFGGGGGVIVPEEIKELEAYGVAKIFSPEDGARLGLQGMINHLVKTLDFPTVSDFNFPLESLSPDNKRLVANLISAAELAKVRQNGHLAKLRAEFNRRIGSRKVPVIGITGTGGAGKSSLTDELIVRILHDLKEVRVAVLSCDPSRRKTGGALLGDRIRMNAIGSPRVYMRSLATRSSSTEIPEVLADALLTVKAAGFDLVITETAGIGQGDSSIVDLVDVSMYVMTSEYGAASQLEKIDMLDFADLAVVNKFEKRGSDDAVQHVRKQVQRNRKAFGQTPEEMPVFGTIASKFNDDGVTALYHALMDTVTAKTGVRFDTRLPRPKGRTSSSKTIIIPPERVRYLSEISETVRSYHAETRQQMDVLREAWHLEAAAQTLETSAGDAPQLLARLKTEARRAEEMLAPETRKSVAEWQEVKDIYSRDELVYAVRDREIRLPLYSESLAHTRIPKIVLPGFEDPAETYRWMREENVPGRFPFTAGVFPLKRADEDPTRMFAGEGDPARTNRRFKLLSANYDAKRLSTAFDSVTLYGFDPDIRPDIYGKVGTSGVSVCTLDDVKVLYGGFELCAPNNSVSMTINGPAPIMLAMFLNTAIDQQVDKFTSEHGRQPDKTEVQAIRARVLQCPRHGPGRHPQGGPGSEHLHLLHRFRLENDGRHPGVLHSEPCAQFLFSVDIRLPHRRGRSEPHHPAGPDARQRLHLCRVLPFPGDAHRQLCAQPFLLLLQRHGSGVHRDRPRGAPHLGGRHAAHVRRYGPCPAAQVPHPDLGPLAAQPGHPVQRRPHHLAGLVRDLRQLQQPAHQRLRRGHHHTEHRIGAPGARNPAHHQPRVGPHQKREHEPGQLHRGGADAVGRGGRPDRVRPHHRTRRRPGRNGNRLPAQQDPGGVALLRSPETRRPAADHRCKHLPGPPCLRGPFY